jgi:hypothetical protein
VETDKFIKTSDKHWEEYWNSLMSESQKPVPWGTIVNEKPEHGDLSATEDTKKHQVKRFKRRRFKIK